MDLFGLDTIWSLFGGPQAAWASLWIVLAMVTAGLLVLMRTRWGESRALEKCVILSVLAHVLLAGLATTVRLASAVAQLAEEDDPVIKITIVDQGQQGTDAAGSGSEGADAFSKKSWDVVANLQTVGPSTESFRRPAFKPDAAQRRPKRTDATASNIGANISHLVSRDVPTVEDDAAKHTLKNDQYSQKKAELIDRPKPKKSDLPKFVGPSTPQIERPLVQSNNNSPTRERNFDNNAIPATSVSNSAQHTLREMIEKESDVRFRKPLGPVPVKNGFVIKRIDGSDLPKIYRSRMSSQPSRIVETEATLETEQSVQSALKWLAANQSRGGNWDADQHGAGRELKIDGHNRKGAGAQADTGITGLAILAFLGNGQTHLKGDHRDTVRRGLNFLIASQTSDGSLAGDARTYARMYCHAMATFAICEAYALTGDKRLRRPAENAIGYCLNAQNESDGGWRYKPGDFGDTSQLGWQVMALKSAELAGIEIPQRTWTQVAKFLSNVSSGQHGGLAAYRPGERKSRTMTAEALLCRQFLGLQSDDPTAIEATNYILEQPPKATARNLYFWYYATLSLHQMKGDSFQRWNRSLVEVLLVNQRKDGQWAGSWNSDTKWGSYGGRAYSTAMAALCLESYYRYMPTKTGVKTADHRHQDITK